jgi:hypothetical protein
MEVESLSSRPDVLATDCHYIWPAPAGQPTTAPHIPPSLLPASYFLLRESQVRCRLSQEVL